MLTNPAKDSKHSFTKFVTTNVGDPYIDVGHFNNKLRNGGQALSSAERAASQIIHKKPFLSSHGHKLIKNTEFDYRANSGERKGSTELRPYVDRLVSGFYNRKTSHEPFTNLNTIGYQEDPYERAEDLRTRDYAKLTG